MIPCDSFGIPSIIFLWRRQEGAHWSIVVASRSQSWEASELGKQNANSSKPKWLRLHTKSSSRDESGDMTMNSFCKHLLISSLSNWLFTSTTSNDRPGMAVSCSKPEAGPQKLLFLRAICRRFTRPVFATWESLDRVLFSSASNNRKSTILS